MVNACTVILRSQSAQASVLAESFFTHHADGELTILIVDDEERKSEDGSLLSQSLRLSDIGMDQLELLRLAMAYDATQLQAAVKPLLIRYLLQSGRTEVLYLDAEMWIHGSLSDLSQLSRIHSVVLVPHATAPLPEDGCGVNESDLLTAGVYNLGLLGVGARSEPFLDWWCGRARRAIRTNSVDGVIEQRWIDSVPCFFEHAVLRDSAYGVGYWNLHARHLLRVGPGYAVDGAPLKCFHFAGFDPRAPHLLSRHQGLRPRVLLSNQSALGRICGEYAEALERTGRLTESHQPYGWAILRSGFALTPRMRRIYRQELAAFDAGTGSEPPNPLAGAERAFLDWLNEPVLFGHRPGVSRYLASIYTDRVDLQSAFPDLAGTDRSSFYEWVRTEGVRQEGIPSHCLPLASRAIEIGSVHVPASQLTEGVNIAGCFRAEAGIGQASRNLLTGLQHAGIRHSIVVSEQIASRKAHPFVKRVDARASPRRQHHLSQRRSNGGVCSGCRSRFF